MGIYAVCAKTKPFFPASYMSSGGCLFSPVSPSSPHPIFSQTQKNNIPPFPEKRCSLLLSRRGEKGMTELKYGRGREKILACFHAPGGLKNNSVF